MEAVREGFESVFPMATLQMFYPDELDQIFCGSSRASYARWEVTSLNEACKPDHGYTTDSKSIRMLYEVMSEYNREEQVISKHLEQTFLADQIKLFKFQLKFEKNSSTNYLNLKC